MCSSIRPLVHWHLRTVVLPARVIVRSVHPWDLVRKTDESESQLPGPVCLLHSPIFLASLLQPTSYDEYSTQISQRIDPQAC